MKGGIEERERHRKREGEGEVSWRQGREGARRGGGVGYEKLIITIEC